jgi:hypothetical protein
MYKIIYTPYNKPKYIGVNDKYFAIHGTCTCDHPDFKSLNFGAEHQSATLVMKHPQHFQRSFNFKEESHDTIIEKATEIVNNYKYEDHLIP